MSEGTLRCLSALPLRIREDERARAKARVKSKNRKRRRDGSVEAGLMEADARVDEDVRAKCQADALHEVCLRCEACRGGLILALVFDAAPECRALLCYYSDDSASVSCLMYVLACLWLSLIHI